MSHTPRSPLGLQGSVTWQLLSRAGAVLIMVALVQAPIVEAQERMAGSVVRLPFGVTLVLPPAWRADREPLTTALASRVAVIDARGLSPEPDGFLVTFASPSGDREVLTLSVAQFAGDLDQAAVSEMDSSRVAKLGQEEYHGELARVTSLAGNTLIAWNGLVKRPIAGMEALEMTYRFRTPSSPELVSRTIMFFRGQKSFRLQFVRARSASSRVRETIDGILLSLKVER